MYNTYSTYVNALCTSNNLAGFKSNPNYTYILEHVSKNQGEEYLKCILSLTKITTDEIIKFCALNDAIGNPKKEKYDNLIISVSPTSLRYIFHSHLILTYMKKINNLKVDIIELGGGYGGLCLSLYHFSHKYGIHINSYKICDLSNIIN